jgi:tetratricopeptide (TPR) repeat protein
MKVSFFAFFLAILSFAFPSEAQTTQSPTPGPPSTITRPDSIQDSGLYGYWTGMTGQGRAGGVLMGKVKVEGEPLLWNPILISVICNGTSVYTTQTDPKGDFQISYPLPENATQSDAERQMETHYEGCTVQPSFTGFHATTTTITQHNLRDDPDLGTLILSRAGGRTAATAVSATIESAPASAVKSFDKARMELLEQKPDRAEHDLEKAVQIYPSFAEAWYQLGRLQQASGSADAEKSYSNAAKADPQFVLPYEQLATLAAQDGKWQAVVDNTNRTLQLDPAGSARTWYLNALGNFQLGKANVAQASALKSLPMDPTHTIPNTEQLLAVVLARKADYAGALSHLRNCLSYLPKGQGADVVKQQIAQLERRLGVSK